MANGIEGLLGNPAFTAGMGLLSAGYDSRINPWQSALQGMAGAQQYKLLDQKRKREEEQYQRQQKAIEQFQQITGQMQQVPMGPPTPGGEMNMQPQPNPMAGLMGALAESGDLGGAASMYTQLQRQMMPTSNASNYELFRKLGDGSGGLTQAQREYMMANAPGSLGGTQTKTDQDGSVWLENRITGERTLLRPASDVTEGVVDRAGRVESATQDAQIAAIPERLQTEASSQALVGLPRAQATAQSTLSTINQLRNHPGREYATGKSAIFPLVPGTDPYDFEQIRKQAVGKVFLEAYQMLKGGGPITDIEGKKAEEAMGRLERAQSEEGFLSALDDLENAVIDGTRNMERAAGSQRNNATTDDGAAEQPMRTSPGGVKYRIVQ
jgi:hypothetical protein